MNTTDLYDDLIIPASEYPPQTVHGIVVAYLIEAKLKGFSNQAAKGKAYAQAKMLAQAGLTAAEIPEFYEWLAWAKNPDLGLMVSQLDRWLLSKMVHPEDEGVIWTGSVKTIDQWNHRERREAREMEQRERERTRAWKATLEDDKRRSEAAER